MNIIMNTITSIINSFKFFDRSILLLIAVFLAAGDVCAMMPGGYKDYHRDQQALLREQQVRDSLWLAFGDDSTRKSLPQKLMDSSEAPVWGTVLISFEKSYSFYEVGCIVGAEFCDWYDGNVAPSLKNILQEDYSRKVDSLPLLPENLQRMYNAGMRLNEFPAPYYYVYKLVYDVFKKFDRETNAWIDVPKDKRKVQKTIVLKSGMDFSVNPAQLYLDKFSLPAGQKYGPRIFFEKGYSAPVDSSKLDSVLLDSSLAYIPVSKSLELDPDEVPYYKSEIIRSLMKKDFAAVEFYRTKIDSLWQKPSESRQYGGSSYEPPLNTCENNFIDLLSGNFFRPLQGENICNVKNFGTQRKTLDQASEQEKFGRTLYTMLKQKVLDGSFERSMDNLNSSDRAFWRIYVQGMMNLDNEEMNQLVVSQIDSVKNWKERDYLFKNYSQFLDYNIMIHLGVGGGYTYIPEDMRKFYDPGSVILSTEVCSDYLCYGINLSEMSGKKLDDETRISTMFTSFNLGYRVFTLDFLTNIWYAGLLLNMSDVSKDSEEKQELLEDEYNVGFTLGTTLDLYVTKPYFEKNYEMNKNVPTIFHHVDVRIGLRLRVGVNYFYLKDIANVKGFVPYIGAELLMQMYDARRTDHKGRTVK